MARVPGISSHACDEDSRSHLSQCARVWDFTDISVRGVVISPVRSTHKTLALFRSLSSNQKTPSDRGEGPRNLWLGVAEGPSQSSGLSMAFSTQSITGREPPFSHDRNPERVDAALSHRDPPHPTPPDLSKNPRLAPLQENEDSEGLQALSSWRFRVPPGCER
jgi:hypothetical protein